MQIIASNQSQTINHREIYIYMSSKFSGCNIYILNKGPLKRVLICYLVILLLKLEPILA